MKDMKEYRQIGWSKDKIQQFDMKISFALFKTISFSFLNILGGQKLIVLPLNWS